MSETAKILINYGSAGVVLAVVLSVFVWAFKRMLERMFEQQDSFKLFMRDIVEAVNKIALSCGACRTDNLAESRDSVHILRNEIVQATNKLSSDMIQLRDKVITDVWAAAGKTIQQVDDLEKEVSRPYQLRRLERADDPSGERRSGR